MIVLSEQKLALLFEEIAKGFVHSPLEISIFIVLVLAIFSTFIFIYRYQVKKNREEKAKKALEIFEQICRVKAFNHTELLALEQLAKYLKLPYEKNLLLEDQSVFNACVKKLQKEMQIPLSVLSALRLKLGFKRENPDEIPHSTAELSKEISVLVVVSGRNQFSGRIVQLDPDSVKIKMEKPVPAPDPGTAVQVYFQKSSGIFSFSARTQKSENGFLWVSHSENIHRLQRREFYRKKLKLPVYIKPTGSSERPLRTTIIDLGGGGASILNTAQNFHEKEDVTLIFFTPRPERMVLTAHVIRVSEGGKTLHVSFGHMLESSRDRIIGYLFRR